MSSVISHSWTQANQGEANIECSCLAMPTGRAKTKKMSKKAKKMRKRKRKKVKKISDYVRKCYTGSLRIGPTLKLLAKCYHYFIKLLFLFICLIFHFFLHFAPMKLDTQCRCLEFSPESIRQLPLSSNLQLSLLYGRECIWSISILFPPRPCIFSRNYSLAGNIRSLALFRGKTYAGLRFGLWG